jgi:hypothetical protein
VLLATVAGVAAYLLMVLGLIAGAAATLLLALAIQTGVITAANEISRIISLLLVLRSRVATP